MLKQRFISSETTPLDRAGNAPRLILISSFFFAGCVLGAFFGTNYSIADISKSAFFGFTSDDGSLLLEVAAFIWLHVLVVLLGTTFLGVAFVPVTALLKGFIFSCASATIISMGSPSGIIIALVALGVPSLFAIPAFIALCDNAFFRAGKLLALMRGDQAAIMQKSDARILLCIPVLALGYIADLKLVPYLISRLT